MRLSKSLLAKAFNITTGAGYGGIASSRPNNDGIGTICKVAIGPGT